MPREAKDITEGELAVLQVLWDRGTPASIRQLTETLYPKNTAAHYGTVQKQLHFLLVDDHRFAIPPGAPSSAQPLHWQAMPVTCSSPG